MSLITILDLAKRRGNDQIVGLVDETTKAVPEVSGRTMVGGSLIQLPNVASVRTIAGLLYQTRVRTVLPSVAFRNFNEGALATKATYENRVVQTYTLNPRWGGDKAALDRDEDGPQAVMAEEAAAHLEAAWQRVARAFYYGTDATYGDAKAFPGLLQSYDATNNVVDAGGTTDSTATSAWLVAFGPQKVQWVYGNGGNFDLSEVDLRDQTDGVGNPYTAYHQELFCYPGLQVSSQRYVVRIKKITADNAKTFKDSLVAEALAKFPTGVVPDVIFCSKRSLSQLQSSRTATNATGAEAPFPTQVFGIPLAVTEALSEVETLAL